MTQELRQSAAARTALEPARLRFPGGLAASLDTVSAQGVLAQSEDLEIRTRYEFQLTQARLAHAQGDIQGLIR